MPLLLLLLGACTDEAVQEDQAGESDERPVAGRFGQPYAISDGPNPDAPVAPPHLEGDTLVTHVSYRGGCEEHTFELRHDRAADTLRLWLQHDADGDACSTRVYQTVRAPLPQSTAGPTVLLTPEETQPLVLE